MSEPLKRIVFRDAVLKFDAEKGESDQDAIERILSGLDKLGLKWFVYTLYKDLHDPDTFEFIEEQKI